MRVDPPPGSGAAGFVAARHLEVAGTSRGAGGNREARPQEYPEVRSEGERGTHTYRRDCGLVSAEAGTSSSGGAESRLRALNRMDGQE